MMFAEFFLEKTNEDLNKKVRGFSADVQRIFLNYYWPGNLRELNNVVKRSTLLCQGNVIEVSALPPEIINYSSALGEHAMTGAAPGTEAGDTMSKLLQGDFSMKHASIDAEFELILEALKKCNYNKSKAAKLLKIDRKTLYNKMKQYKELNS
jgi:two-component system response regulator HydG